MLHKTVKYAATAIIASSLLVSSALAASVADWRRDIEAIVLDVQGTHPDPFAKVGRLTFLRAAEAIKDDLPTLSEEQRMVRAMQLIAMLGDGHSILEPYENERFAWWYPIRIYEFTDGYFVVSAHQSVSDLAGAQLLEVGGAPIEEAAAAARSVRGADNPMFLKERIDAFSNAGLMKGIGYAAEDRSLKAKFKLRNGHIVTRTLKAHRSGSDDYGENESTDAYRYYSEVFGTPFGNDDEWISAYKNLSAKLFLTIDDNRPPHLTYRSTFVARALPEEDAYYIQVNVVGNGRDETLVSFLQRALSEVDKQKPKHLIVDLRYNFGGDGSNIPRIVTEFLARKNNQPWENLYVLTGRRTFSAAVLWVDAFLKYVAPVTLIGEPAGAPLNTFGDTNSFYFEDTGLRMYISYERHEQGKSTDLSEYIPIDVPAQFSFADYAAGRDPAIDPILAGEEMRSIPVIALNSGADAARKAYRERLSKFSQITWWRRPAEISLREVMRTLKDRGEIDRAIDVAELNAEINPTEWRTWYNLGNAQYDAGRKKEALESYRRCLALNDPTNFNKLWLEGRVAELESEFD